MDKNVALPEAGEEAFLRFTGEAMEALYSQLGDGYLAASLGKLQRCDLPTVKLCLLHMLKGADADLPTLLERVTIDDLTTRIADAIYVSWRGKRLSELMDAE